MEIQELIAAAYMLDPEATKAVIEDDLGLPCMDEERLRYDYDQALDEYGFESLDLDPARVLKKVAPVAYMAAMHESSAETGLEDEQAEEAFDDFLRNEGTGVLANFNITPSEALKGTDEIAYNMGFGEYCSDRINLSDGTLDLLPEDKIASVPDMYLTHDDIDLIEPEELVQALGERISDPAMEVPLFQFAAGQGLLDYVNDQIEFGMDVNSQLPDGNTALHQASMEGKKAIVEVLLSEGADLNLQNNNGRTAIDVAGDDEIRSILQTHQLEQNTAKIPDRFRTDDWSPSPDAEANGLARIRASQELGGDEIQVPTRSRAMRL